MMLRSVPSTRYPTPGARRLRRAAGALALAALLVPTATLAADPYAPYGPGPSVALPRGASTPADDVILTVGAGGLIVPRYEGAESYMLSPWPILGLKVLRAPILGELGGPDEGLKVRPAFKVIGSRDPADNRELRGLDEVDWTLEVGARVEFVLPYARVFAEARRGFGGHDGYQLDLGADAILRPTERLEIKVGPRVTFADESFMRTYFGVTAAEAITSTFAAYRPDAGLKSAGLFLAAEYALTERWSLHMEAGWDRLLGDAAKSPIVKEAGSVDQFRFGLGASYRFGLDLWN